MSKIGLLGGSFNPVHKGHLYIAKSAINHYHLEKILFIPVGINPFKSDQQQIKKKHRMNMLNLALQNYDEFQVLDYEINQSGKTYTIYTINYLKKVYPDDEFYFITGADLMFEIQNWKDSIKLFNELKFITTQRSGYLGLEQRLENLRNEYKADIRNMNIPGINITSSEIREKILRDEDVSHLLPDSVEDYIMMHKLYKKN